MSQPLHKIKRGGLEVTMWQRPGQQGMMTNFGLSRSYKNKNDQWVNEQIYLRPAQVTTVEMLLKEMLAYSQNYQAQQKAQQAQQPTQQPPQAPQQPQPQATEQSTQFTTSVNTVLPQQPVTPPLNNPFADQGDGIPV